MPMLEGAPDYLVFRHKPGEWWNPANCQSRGDKGPERDRQFLTQATHLAHVLLSTHRVDDRPRSKKQACLEKRVGHQMENASRICSDANSYKHVTELADGRVGEYPL